MITINKLLWDEWNVAHIARHDVSQIEVEEVCHSDPIVEQGKKGRLLIIGYSLNKRILSIILDPEDQKDVYYPVTARTASKKERKIYEIIKSGGENQ
jgi:uncharacterized DUF497 family protein